MINSKPILFPTTSILAPPADFDFLPFRECYGSLPVSEKMYVILSFLSFIIDVIMSLRSLYRITNFTNLGTFLNPSRTKPSLVSPFTSGKYISLSPSGGGDASRYTSVFLTTGVIDRSSIYKVVPVNLSNGGTRVVRELHLKPFLQEFQLLCGFFASAMSFEAIAMQASGGVITFASSQYFPEWQRDKVNPNDYSPLTKSMSAQTHNILLTIVHSASSTSSSLLQWFRPQDDTLCLLYNAYIFCARKYVIIYSLIPFHPTHLYPISVPIYDGRASNIDAPFQCTPRQLYEVGIGSYPLYQGGNVDLPPGSTVAVGYTAHTYPNKAHFRGVAKTLSLNLAFVILIALPDSYMSSTSTSPFTHYSYNNPDHSAHQQLSLSPSPVPTVPHDNHDDQSIQYLEDLDPSTWSRAQSRRSA